MGAWATGVTIAAIATAIVPQQGSVAIVRISGPQAWDVARSVFRAPGRQTWESHRILYGAVWDHQAAEAVDEALLLLMQAPRTFTREDVAELHCHGGIMVVQRVLQLCVRAGARLAEPGEFTLRAFLNGRIDLTQAESIADLVGAQSPQAAQTALAGVRGHLAAPIRSLRSHCMDILAEIEARIDFEEDLPPLDRPATVTALATVSADIDQLIATADRGELLRSGLKVAIVGRPNAGKSSLLNAWSRSDRAIVTDLPGTTRDVVESRLVVGGIPVQVLDTAGIRETSDRVEQLGVARSREAARAADVVVMVVDAAVGWTAEDTAIYTQLQGDRPLPILLTWNKIDLVPTLSDLPPVPAAIAVQHTVHTVAATGAGIEDLETAILALVQAEGLVAADLEVAINQRHRAALVQVQGAIAQVQGAIAADLPLDFWTIDLRDAVRILGEITGEEATESVLDRIFSRFCIGK
jgi:tRNA modification GTPase